MAVCWPVPVAAPTNLHETVGNFWEDRGDRHHCGIDIYVSEGAEVVSIADGQVSIIGLFTTPEQVRYWNQTYHIIINHGKRIFCRYAELSDLLVVSGQRVHAGQVIGHVGTVLNEDRIDDMVPKYVQQLTLAQRVSMLHFEVLNAIPHKALKYKGGNLFGTKKKEPWMNPMIVLKNHK